MCVCITFLFYCLFIKAMAKICPPLILATSCPCSVLMKKTMSNITESLKPFLVFVVALPLYILFCHLSVLLTITW